MNLAVELLGYTASGLVILSLSMRSVVRLRIISLCGSLAFLVYGALISAPPIIVTNICLLALNLWFLTQEFQRRGNNQRTDLGVSRIRSDSPFLLDFVEYHLDDIRSFQPSFSMPSGDDVVSLLLNRDGLPAGLIVGRRQGEQRDTLRIDLDYVLREHRDSRLGLWLYGRGGREVFRELGIQTVCADAATEAHHKYLRRVGFDPSDVAPRTHYELTV
ncbi:MAG: hypothetical protein AB8G26_14895 [Ilumatobacter sp.]